MPAALGTPDEIAGGAFALVINQPALDDIGLLDIDMHVQRQLGAGRPFEQLGRQSGFLVLHEDFGLDARNRVFCQGN